MEHARRFLKGIALSALASVLFYGAALAVPSPTYPGFDPGSDAALTNARPATVAMAPGARVLHRTSSLSSGTFRGGGSLAATTAGGTTRSSALKNRYLLSGMVLAALTPIALHRSGEPGDKSVVVQTRPPGSSSLPNLGDAISTGHGHGRDGNGNNGNNGNGGNGGSDGDNGDCTGDDGDQGSGDEVCDSGDSGDNGGDTGSGGECDNGGGNNSGGDNGGGDNGGGGGNGGGGTSLPEPGTIPLLGAGLMMALAIRSRRDR